MDVVSWLLSKSYVDKTLRGMGALKGSPAMISSIIDNPDGTHDITFSWKDNSDVTHTSILTVANGETPTITSTEIEGGHTITFATTDPSQSVSFNVMDGEEGQRGVSVIRADVDNNNYLKLELSDGNIINAGQIKTVSMVDNTLSLVSENPVQNKVITKKFDEYKTAFTGTEEEWNALTSEEQNVYDIMNITNDGDVLNLGVYLEKKTAMPVASEDVENKIYLYTGTTTQDYKKGVVYQCVSDGEDPATYSWVALIDFGTAAIKNSTDRVSPNNTDLVESQSVYSAINTALSSIYTPRGDITCAELTSALLISDNIGNVYETSDSGTTTALFLQGAGHPIATRDNVGIINAGESRILFNLMANAFDLTDYQKKDLTSAVEGQTTVEGALGALSTNKASKVSGATNGNFAGLDASGNLTDSGKKPSDFQTVLTFDNVPTENSNNPVKSGGVYSLKETLTNFEESITGEVVDSEPYVLRQGLGNLADMALVGGSVAWNQLISNGNFADTSGWPTSNNANISVSSGIATLTPKDTSVSGSRFIMKYNVPAIAGHKYFLSITTNFASGENDAHVNLRKDYSGNNLAVSIVGTGNFSKTEKIIMPNFTGDCQFQIVFDGIASLQAKDVNLIDLTQMFGSTIADYIYSLEQATAGAGVAWFRQYFRNLYYGYDAGSIQSVNVASRKVVGKNLLKNDFITNGTVYGVRITKNYDNSVTFDGTATAEIYNATWLDTDLRLQIGRYTLSGNQTGLNIQICNKAETKAWFNFPNGQNASFDVTSEMVGDIKIRFIIPNGRVLHNVTAYPMIRLATVEDATYVPYQSSTYAFDSSIQLRGMFRLDANHKLYADGDIYTADGTVTRKYGIVDLGTLDWSYEASLATPVFSCSASAINAKLQQTNIVCPLYTPKVSFWSQSGNDKCIAVGGGALNISNSSYTDAAAFKTAMSGVYAVYELATPTTELATPFQNPQRAFIDGTEEFVDAGVTAATRDVSIPVGNNTTYQLNETLPSIENYVDGALKQPTREIIGLVDNVNNNGAKNLLPMTLAEIKRLNTSGTWSGNTYTINGISFAVQTDNDGNITGITANGTVTGSTTQLVLYMDYKLQKGIPYILSGGISSNRKIYYANSNSSHWVDDNGNSPTFTINDDLMQRVLIAISVGEVCSNVNFYPMLRLASDPDSTFEPYAMTNRELTNAVQSIEVSFSPFDNRVGDINSTVRTVVKKKGNLVIASIHCKVLTNFGTNNDTIYTFDSSLRPSSHRYSTAVVKSGSTFKSFPIQVDSINNFINLLHDGLQADDEITANIVYTLD